MIIFQYLFLGSLLHLGALQAAQYSPMETTSCSQPGEIPVNIHTTIKAELERLEETREQNSEIANLREMLNQSETRLNYEIADLRVKQNQSQNALTTIQQELRNLQNSIAMVLYAKGTRDNPASSCGDIAQGSPSGEYWIQNNNTNSLVQVYCDMTRTCCSTTGGWMRVANLDMTDPNQQCPDGFLQMSSTTAPLRTCGRPDNFIGCVSNTFSTYGIEYSQVCGRIVAYQYASPDAFDGYFFDQTLTIDDLYVDGISLTHGQSPRQHIWTFVGALAESRDDEHICPCTRSTSTFTGIIPPFVGQDYFCDTAGRFWANQIYPDDPLWDGQGCGSSSTCCSFNNPPWFCKTLPQPTADDIELRLCGDQDTTDEDTPIEVVEVFIY